MTELNEINDLEELFEYQLTGMYYTEQQLVDALDELARDATNDKLSKGFADHREETEAHVERLESVFEAMGMTPETREVPSVDGLIEEKEAFDSMASDENARDLFYTSAGMKSEHLEITSYDALETIASKLDLDDNVTGPLEQNMNDEEKALGKLETIAKGSEYKSLLDRLL